MLGSSKLLVQISCIMLSLCMVWTRAYYNSITQVKIWMNYQKQISSVQIIKSYLKSQKTTLEKGSEPWMVRHSSSIYCNVKDIYLRNKRFLRNEFSSRVLATEPDSCNVKLPCELISKCNKYPDEYLPLIVLFCNICLCVCVHLNEGAAPPPVSSLMMVPGGTATRWMKITDTCSVDWLSHATSHCDNLY